MNHYIHDFSSASHVLLGRCGRNHLLSRLCQHYWLISANAAARKRISPCVTCRWSTLTRSLPVYNVGVDVFGPFEVKMSCRFVKGYLVIFTCMSSKAEHLEVTYSLDTSSCIHALCRLIARRDQVSHFRLDNRYSCCSASRCGVGKAQSHDQDRAEYFISKE